MKNVLLAAIFLMSIWNTCLGQQEIRLYPGRAPGSENWDWKEQNIGGGTIMNVVDPTLTAFVPAKPNGLAVIIAPGGAFHFLAWENEGTAVAKRLNDKGITAFVLKYRLVHENPAHPYLMKMLQTKNARMMDSVTAPVIGLQVADGMKAVQYVREHASQYRIDRNLIGIMGFSAGGTVAMSVAYSGTGESHPNFVAPIYGYGPLVVGTEVPKEVTPIFVCAASNDQDVQPTNSIDFYMKWLKAGQPAELHMYEMGGHGFGMKIQDLPVDRWADKFTEWLTTRYALKK